MLPLVVKVIMNMILEIPIKEIEGRHVGARSFRMKLKMKDNDTKESEVLDCSSSPTFLVLQMAG